MGSGSTFLSAIAQFFLFIVILLVFFRLSFEVSVFLGLFITFLLGDSWTYSIDYPYTLLYFVSPLVVYFWGRYNDILDSQISWMMILYVFLLIKILWGDSGRARMNTFGF